MAQGTTKGVPIDVDPTLAADSDLLVPSQKAIKTYVNTANSTKQDNITLTTTGTSGAATFIGSTLNVPQYSSIYAKSLSTFTSTGTTATQILTSVLIPANTFVAGDVLRVTARLRKTGTASSANFALGINTTLSPSGAVTFKTNSIGATIPSFGVKLDACPGRLNQAQVYVYRTGTFYGQCSEICGVNHAFMPIAIACVEQKIYSIFVFEQMIKYLN